MDEKPTDDFTLLPVHPTVRDVTTKATLRKNKETGSKFVTWFP